MKLFLILVLSSMSLLAQTVGLNQSYILMDNGKALTVKSYYPNDDQIKLFQVDSYFFNLNRIEELRSNYLIDKDDNLFAVTSDGFMYKYDNYKTDSRIKDYGETFFVTRKGSVYVIKNDGSIHINSHELFEDKIKADITGANYMITNDDKVIMVNPITGKLHMTNTVIEAKNVKVSSNNYLTTEDRELYTFGFIKDEKGNYKEVISKIITPLTNEITKVGGNYFFDIYNNIHTVSFTGLFDLGVKDRELKVTNSLDNVDRSIMRANQVGSNYFIYNDGSVYIVDHNGYFGHLDTIEPRVGFTSK